MNEIHMRCKNHQIIRESVGLVVILNECRNIQKKKAWCFANIGTSSAVVVMRRSRTASCQADLTVNRVLLGQST